MRRARFAVLAVALVAVACTTPEAQPEASPVDDGAFAARTVPTAQAASTAQAAPTAEAVLTAEAASIDRAEPAAVAAPATPNAAAEATCGFEAGYEPERVEVAHTARTPIDPTIPSALANRSHPDFPEPLIDTAEILSGGPPPDGIPPIDTPRFQTAASVDWLRCNEPVLSLVVDGDARAYPVQIMTWHEIVNDTVGEVPVTVSFCPLCNSALVYRRDVDGQVLDFGTSGLLFNSSLVMYDRQTESLWTHFNGTAVIGTLTGTELELLPVQTTSWANFLRQHPDGIALTRETGHRRRYGENPYVGYDTTETDPFLFRGELDDRLAAKERVVSIGQRDDSVAVVLGHLVDKGVVSVEVEGRELTVWHLPGTSSALDTSRIADGKDIGTVGVFLPEVDGSALTFRRDAEGRFVDAETGSTWDIGGVAVDGELAGARLESVEHLDTFWFAIAAFEPETRLVR